MEPIILDKPFDEETRGRLLVDCDRVWRRQACEYDPKFSRMTSNDNRLWMYLERLLPLARETFKDDTILPSYACWAMYYEPTSSLSKHKDKNACTYTLDYCVRQYEPWELFVEGKPYTLQEDQALAFMGEDQEHWRPDFKPGNVVEMIFFHFVHPDHWYFTD
jgi:hypothetical protein